MYPLLDLHGHTGDEARRTAERWLRARRSEGERTVVVVTGRGNRSSGPPVLRAEIEDLLVSLAGSLVAAFELVEGGGGFRVTLARASVPSARRDPSAGAVRGMDPALLRRAEEALWELGIAPTPALLRAEVRRILEEESDGEEDG